MSTQMGLWIDHRKAIIVALKEKGEEIALVISNVQRQLRRAGDSPLKGSYETRRVPADDSRQRAFTGHLNIFYHAVIACIRKAELILIFGPGEAKGELKECLVRCKRGGRIAALETADKMTVRQIAAKVRTYFEKINGQDGGGHSRRGSTKAKHNQAKRKSSITRDGSRHNDND